MTKAFFVFIPATLLFIATPFLNHEEKIRITQTYPQSIKSGEEFVIVLTVENNGVKGVVRLQQNLPQGFHAVNIDAHGGDFIFENNQVKYAWSSMPEEESFKISYKITPDKNISGYRTINGFFIYVDDGKSHRFTLNALEIEIGDRNLSLNSPVISRKLITTSFEHGEYKVELSISPNGVQQAAEFTDQIPAGFTAEVINSNGSNFSFENNNAIFKWDKLPDTPEFTISYQVRSGKPGPAPLINGVMVYQSIPADKEYHGDQQSVEVPSSKTPDNLMSPVGSEQTAASDPVPPPAVPVQPIPVSQKGVVYKVQIAATQHTEVRDNNWWNRAYDIRSQVELTYHNGWKKYMIGELNSFTEAKILKNKTRVKISDAFIVAYENGSRITLHQALNRQHLNQ